MKGSKAIGVILIVIALLILTSLLGGDGIGLSSELMMNPIMSAVDIIIAVLLLLGGLYMLRNATLHTRTHKTNFCFSSMTR